MKKRTSKLTIYPLYITVPFFSKEGEETQSKYSPPTTLFQKFSIFIL